MLATALVWTAASQAVSPDLNKETWEWDAKVPTCALKQHRSDGADGVTIERTPGGEETQLFLTLEPSLKIGNGRFLDATMRMDSGRTYRGDIILGPDSRGRPQRYIDSADPAFIESLSATKALNISYGKNQTITVPIEVPAKVIATLRGCEDTTMRDWGIDPVAWRGLLSRPRPAEHVKERFRDLDYPADSLAANVEADAVVRLDVGADGSVTKCRMVNAGVPKSFETASCNVLKGAKFTPAADTTGKPVSAPIVYDVRFRIGS